MYLDSLAWAYSHGEKFLELSAAIHPKSFWVKCSVEGPSSVRLIAIRKPTHWLVGIGNHKAAFLAARVDEKMCSDGGICRTAVCPRVTDWSFWKSYGTNF